MATRYIEAVGRRKEAVAQVRITPGGKDFLVNGKRLIEYFPTETLQNISKQPFTLLNTDTYGVSVKVRGGGIHAQAEAIRHGLTRSLMEHNKEFRTEFKRAGFITRDPRAKERRKFGLKKARRAPQWSKR